MPKSGELGDASPLCPFSCRLTLGICQGQRLSCLFDTFLHNLNLQVTSKQGTPCPHFFLLFANLSPCDMPRVCGPAGSAWSRGMSVCVCV